MRNCFTARNISIRLKAMLTDEWYKEKTRGDMKKEATYFQCHSKSAKLKLYVKTILIILKLKLRAFWTLKGKENAMSRQRQSLPIWYQFYTLSKRIRNQPKQTYFKSKALFLAKFVAQALVTSVNTIHNMYFIFTNFLSVLYITSM